MSLRTFLWLALPIWLITVTSTTPEERLKEASVKKFVAAQLDLWEAESLAALLAKSPTEGDATQSGLSKAREAQVAAQSRVDELSADPKFSSTCGKVVAPPQSTHLSVKYAGSAPKTAWSMCVKSRSSWLIGRALGLQRQRSPRKVR